jgi:hypothetical protein
VASCASHAGMAEACAAAGVEPAATHDWRILFDELG